MSGYETSLGLFDVTPVNVDNFLYNHLRTPGAKLYIGWLVWCTTITTPHPLILHAQLGGVVRAAWPVSVWVIWVVRPWRVWASIREMLRV